MHTNIPQVMSGVTGKRNGVKNRFAPGGGPARSHRLSDTLPMELYGIHTIYRATVGDRIFQDFESRSNTGSNPAGTTKARAGQNR